MVILNFIFFFIIIIVYFIFFKLYVEEKTIFCKPLQMHINYAPI